mmetsp:Transcript_14445/g.31406  ORF Transcript_14445/g.31406 Transcript_14445/m.31406 type:complete len:535 (+) Transcript_14445:237-1841(+)
MFHVDHEGVTSQDSFPAYCHSVDPSPYSLTTSLDDDLEPRLGLHRDGVGELVLRPPLRGGHSYREISHDRRQDQPRLEPREPLPYAVATAGREGEEGESPSLPLLVGRVDPTFREEGLGIVPVVRMAVQQEEANREARRSGDAVPSEGFVVGVESREHPHRRIETQRLVQHPVEIVVAFQFLHRRPRPLEILVELLLHVRVLCEGVQYPVEPRRGRFVSRHEECLCFVAKLLPAEFAVATFGIWILRLKKQMQKRFFIVLISVIAFVGVLQDLIYSLVQQALGSPNFWIENGVQFREACYGEKDGQGVQHEGLREERGEGIRSVSRRDSTFLRLLFQPLQGAELVRKQNRSHHVQRQRAHVIRHRNLLVAGGERFPKLHQPRRQRRHHLGQSVAQHPHVEGRLYDPSMAHPVLSLQRHEPVADAALEEEISLLVPRSAPASAAFRRRQYRADDGLVEDEDVVSADEGGVVKQRRSLPTTIAAVAHDFVQPSFVRGHERFFANFGEASLEEGAVLRTGDFIEGRGVPKEVVAGKF